jgi:hypothetical protein
MDSIYKPYIEELKLGVTSIYDKIYESDYSLRDDQKKKSEDEKWDKLIYNKEKINSATFTNAFGPKSKIVFDILSNENNMIIPENLPDNLNAYPIKQNEFFLKLSDAAYAKYSTKIKSTPQAKGGRRTFKRKIKNSKKTRRHYL